MVADRRVTSSPQQSADSRLETRTVPDRSPRRRWPRLWFRVVLLLLVLSCVELICLVAVRLRYGPGGQLAADRRQIATAAVLAQGVNRRIQLPVVVHPYQGAVTRPTEPGRRSPEDDGFVGSFGFHGIDSPVRKRSEDRLIVAVTGGSVARQMVEDAGSVLRDMLARHPDYQDRAVRILPLAVDGYKQPQQLTTLTYLMSLGAEFDIVINLDGLNEVALPVMDNVPAGVFAAFPRQWGTLIRSMDSLEIKRQAGYVTYLRFRRRDQARWFESIPPYRSPAALLIWKQLDDRVARQIYREQRRLAELLEARGNDPAMGPPQSFADRADAYAYCADIWFRSSLVMHRLCSSNGARYFHFLQPNQYVDGSKPMEEAERQVSISRRSPFADPVRRAYPLLVDRGRTLNRHGVAFTDLRQVYSQLSEAVYVDDCCHVNAVGSRILARAIGRAVLAALE